MVTIKAYTLLANLHLINGMHTVPWVCAPAGALIFAVIAFRSTGEDVHWEPQLQTAL